MATSQTALDVLRQRTIVDCDTMDAQVAQTFGPFQDCTSNQAIAFFELSKPEHSLLISESVSEAMGLTPRFPGPSVEELAVEIAMIKLALKIAPHIKGYIHIQTNPYYSYSTEKTIVNALRIIQLAQHLQPGFPQSRICIKIPSTWEGLLACRALEQAGVRTLATTLFTLTQAALAAEVNCTYVAPYVNQLKVHFEPGFTDPAKLLPLCPQIQAYYHQIGSRTLVLPASLTSTTEILALAGVHHITIAPGLLQQLAALPGVEAGVSTNTTTASLFDATNPVVNADTDTDNGQLPKSPLSFVNNEAAYRLAFTRDAGGESEGKLVQAVNIFCDMQDKLVQLMAAVMQRSV
ncbi:transaldolase family protein [Aspergillus saccharolyticus JOP 1030-1]|uniref:Transaldolase n=1 Tax=Aspergillus saccharolyticus JOP 1030-1 TaxID=1450539 RepID=A0A318ZWY7_9EURO|nr:transaldolase [Aspergillus saccharolyticus JOP 1030-1]PYH48833.1 transaldolase [Aspergillus saccharolyticus JOP 1030-1]